MQDIFLLKFSVGYSLPVFATPEVGNTVFVAAAGGYRQHPLSESRPYHRQADGAQRPPLQGEQKVCRGSLHVLQPRRHQLVQAPGVEDQARASRPHQGTSR